MFGNVPALLRKLRASADLSQAEAAAAAGISQRTLSGYEKGRASPTVEVFEKLMAAFGVRSLLQLIEVVSGASAPADEIREAAAEQLRAISPGKSSDYYRGLADAYAKIAETVDAEKPKT